MAEKSTYPYKIDPQWVDFTMRITPSALTNLVLSVAGVDAQLKGFGTDVLNRDNYSWVLLRMAIEYDRRPEQFTEITITTWVSDYQRMMSTRNFTLQDANGEEFGRVVTQWCMLDLGTRRPVDLTLPVVANTYGQFVVEVPSPCESPRRLGVVTPQSSEPHRVAYSDIDFNGHVNTLRYMDMMLDQLDIECFRQDRPMRIDLNFQRECRYGQTLMINHESREGEEFFEIASDGTAAVRGRLEWK